MPKIILTNHAKCRLLERGIDLSNVKKVIKNSLKTKIVLYGTVEADGVTHDGKMLRVIYTKEENKIIIKTSYFL